MSSPATPVASHQSPRRVDIGCGNPDQKYEGCFGIDVNASASPDLVHNCDEGIPFEDGSLEFIHSDNSLEHFKNPRFVLEECYRTLEPGGRMLLVVPNAQWFPLVIVNLFVDLDWLWHTWMTSRFKEGRGVHWTLYTPYLITKTVEDVGFTVLDRKGFLYSKNVTLNLQKPGR